MKLTRTFALFRVYSVEPESPDTFGQAPLLSLKALPLDKLLEYKGNKLRRNRQLPIV